MIPNFRRPRKSPEEVLLSRKAQAKVAGLKLKKLRIKRDKKNKAVRMARRLQKKNGGR